MVEITKRVRRRWRKRRWRRERKRREETVMMVGKEEGKEDVKEEEVV